MKLLKTENHLRYTSLVLYILLLSSRAFSQTYQITGHVCDSETGAALPFATIQFPEKNMGTTSNIDGKFGIELPKGEFKVTVSFVGYQTVSKKITIPADKRLQFSLKPYSVIMPEVVIGSDKEDPAYGIIRRAIQRKAENKKGLSRFQYKAYSKKMFTSAGQIAFIDESIIDGYAVPGKWRREFPLATFKSENLKSRAGRTINMSKLKISNIDFTDNTMEVMGNKVHLPLADDALEYYKYRLADTKKLANDIIYTIEVIPSSKIRPLLKGNIIIEEGSFALIGADLRNNEGLSVPYATDFQIGYEQKLNKFGGYWLPQFTRLAYSAGLNFGGLVSLDKMEFNQIFSISEYRINQNFPDSVQSVKNPLNNEYLKLADTLTLAKPVELKKSQIDSLRPIPLSLSEIKAFAELDSTKRLKNFIKVKGPLAAAAKIDDPGEDGKKDKSLSGELIQYADFFNSRVGGISLGGKYSGSLNSCLDMSLNASYSLGLKRIEGGGMLDIKLDKSGQNVISLGSNSGVKRWNETSQFPELINTLNVTLGLEDNYNYIWAEGFSAGFSKKLSENIKVSIKCSTERQYSLTDIHHQRIFNADCGNRDNPVIKEGRNNNIKLRLIAGADISEFQIMPQDGVVLDLNRSIKTFNGSFDYWSMYSASQLQFKTLFSELLNAPYLLLKAECGYISGKYGPQNMLLPENSEGYFTAFGQFKGIRPYEFTGNKMAAFHAEHNWRTVVFQWFGLNFLRNMNLNLITGGSLLKLWNNTQYSYADKKDDYYWEAYGGISGIFGFLRTDITYTSTKRTVARLGASLSF